MAKSFHQLPRKDQTPRKSERRIGKARNHCVSSPLILICTGDEVKKRERGEGKERSFLLREKRERGPV